ncbi:MAG: hypothetical protein IT214_11070 [Chitinophagaceae bacterium]|jgi:hypothetical protein|nr:hypothetical protein [Chitinophagaceae bacterium]OQY95681.1 MAG: hypothetical protein B6D37_04300 [Sphingobacteriales bacterium UTBCD1]
MYNPFVLLNEKLLVAMLQQPMYFIREYYPEEPGNNKTIVPLLFTHYTQQGVDAERAKRHYGLIKGDPYRYFYDTSAVTDMQKLKAAALQPEGYRIYANILPAEWLPPPFLKKCVYNYMAKNFDWQDYRQNDHLKIAMQDLFGKLYLILTWKGNKVEVILNEIEKYG